MIVWGEEGDLDSFSPGLDSSGKMRSVLKPHAKTKLSISAHVDSDSNRSTFTMRSY